MAAKAGIALPNPATRRSAAELRRLLEAIIKGRHGDHPGLARDLRRRLRLKGIHPGDSDAPLSVNPLILEQIHRLADDLGIDTQAVRERPAPPTTRGRTKQILDRILRPKTREERQRTRALRAKLLLRGIDPEAYTNKTPDDPKTLRQVEEIAHRLGLAP
jgi:hypothetical protein